VEARNVSDSRLTSVAIESGVPADLQTCHTAKVAGYVVEGHVPAEDIQRIVTGNNGDLVKACEALVQEANDRGGEDNITVVLARFLGDDLEAPATEKITIELPPLDEDKTLDDGYEADTEPR